MELDNKVYQANCCFSGLLKTQMYLKTWLKVSVIKLRLQRPLQQKYFQ